MKKFLVGLLAVIGFFSIVAVFGFAVLVLLASSGKPTVPSSVLLEIDFEQGVIETIPPDPLAQLMLDDTMTVPMIVEALEKASDDRRVKGVVARIGGEGIAMAHIQEIRDAVLRFRESGKPAVAWSETFGEFGPGNGGYYLATAFDEIYMQPSGDVGLTGLIYETMFMRGLYDKLDIELQLDQRHEYKNAMNSYTHREYTEPHREVMQSVIDSRFTQIVRGISETRGLEEDEVRDLFDRGPYLGEEAMDAGLVDGLAYRDEVYATMRESVGDKARLLYLPAYRERAGSPFNKGTTVAVIHGYGQVTRGGSRFSPLDGSVSMGSDTLTRAFRAAIDDDRVKAILFRVDSPGGSYVASDSIWRETLRAKEMGKPIIVSMGNLAGSGGYFVVMHADHVVAQPGTITGSIGVLGGKMVVTGLYEKLGISYDGVHTSRNSSQYSPNHPYDDAGYERFQAGLDRIYADFTQKVAEGRGLDLERVQEIAKGRIWTGEQALEIGLIDELGGIHVALDAIRATLDLAPDAQLKLREFPRVDMPWFAGLIEKTENSDVRSQAIVESLREIQPQIRGLRQAGWLGDPGVLVMQDYRALEPRVQIP
ncbi:MAG: signal peptide peptidase SppA [Acidobacteriota bacterium]|nr:signal peptide peptidase SppA [Acidobacteriota bacterium]MDH3784897.1 signal peptide peptidase SppA [Acidobacteriota bacterium]